MNVAVGDTVVLPEYGATPIKFDNVEYLIFRENELLGKLSK